MLAVPCCLGICPYLTLVCVPLYLPTILQVVSEHGVLPRVGFYALLYLAMLEAALFWLCGWGPSLYFLCLWLCSWGQGLLLASGFAGGGM